MLSSLMPTPLLLRQSQLAIKAMQPLDAKGHNVRTGVTILTVTNGLGCNLGSAKPRYNLMVHFLSGYGVRVRGGPSGFARLAGLIEVCRGKRRDCFFDEERKSEKCDYANKFYRCQSRTMNTVPYGSYM